MALTAIIIRHQSSSSFYLTQLKQVSDSNCLSGCRWFCLSSPESPLVQPTCCPFCPGTLMKLHQTSFKLLKAPTTTLMIGQSAFHCFPFALSCFSKQLFYFFYICRPTNHTVSELCSLLIDRCVSHFSFFPPFFPDPSTENGCKGLLKQWWFVCLFLLPLRKVWGLVQTEMQFVQPFCLLFQKPAIVGDRVCRNVFIRAKQ